jgi:hypothetical protein
MIVEFILIHKEEYPFENAIRKVKWRDRGV